MATSNINKDLLIVENVTASGLTIAPNAYGSISINVSKSGYKPLGVMSIEKNGSAAGYCTLSIFYFNPQRTSLTVGVVNDNSAYTAELSVTVGILYQKL